MEFKITHNLQNLHKAEKIAFEALVEQAQVLKDDANKLVPEADSDLRLSSKVTKFPTQDAVVVSYDTKYAVRQHEDLTLHHPDPRNPKSRSGRKARWLEITAKNQAGRYFKSMARAIKSRMGR